MPRRVFPCLLALLPLFAAGCVHLRSDGTTSVYTYDFWVGPLVVLGALLLVPLGLWMVVWREGWRAKAAGGFFLLLCLGLLVGALPGMYTDHVTVTPDRFICRHGLWWTPTVHDVRFDQLAGITIREEISQTRQGPQSNFYLDCRGRNGVVDRVPVGDLMRPAVPEILRNARARGVPVDGVPLR